ncbi:MAG: hypothetical protein ACXWLM_06005 [Myxococcales bacterium]
MPANTTAATVYWTRPGSKTEYDALAATISGTTATAKVSHFSQGFVGLPCEPGASCNSASACHAAAIACTTGAPVCTDTGSNLADGTSCGTGQVCKSGSCGPACGAGQSCTPATSADPCKTYATSCSSSTAAPDCNLSGNQPDGTGCGGGNVCSSGHCVAACPQGTACTPTSIDPCKTYANSCSSSTATPVCAASGNEPDGTGCGSGFVCSTGSCVQACVPAQPCNPASGANACATYATACDQTLTHTSCVQTGTLADFDSCGADHLCRAGTCVGLRTVSGKFETVFTPDSGSSTTKVTSAAVASEVDVLVPDGTASGYHKFTTTVASDGSFSLANVPEGNYFLETIVTGYGAPALVELTTSTPDMSQVSANRPDLVYQASPTSFTMNVSGLDPWIRGGLYAGDRFDIASSQAAFVEGPSAPFLGLQPAADSTSWSATFDWTDPAEIKPTGLPDASKGDVVYFMQMHHTTIGSGDAQLAMRRATKYAAVSDLSIADGDTVSYDVAMTAADQTGSMPANVLYTAFDALATAVNPHATPLNFSSNVFGDPYQLDYPHGPNNLGPLASVNTSSYMHLFFMGNSSFPSALPDTDYGTQSWGQFLDARWHEMRQTLYSYDTPIDGPAGTTADPGATYAAFEAISGVGPTIEPLVGPVTAPQIEGADAFAVQTGVGLQPVISWNAPAVGTATSYQVALYDFATGANLVTANVYSGTAFKVPEGVLSGGGSYFAIITANSGPSDRLDNAPLRGGLPVAGMPCVTAGFAP